ncbi:hypothetical protein Y032_0008g43 [Ancylostoma ceylanicum]|uniref:Uncharacterized protein n=1 Tax=Ancylostoma ceylanicum TaxID=53326 RepID=A0A016VN70_9BILA|nr:hypothetical protein Y032_0008g43 [Ancylostoma ceylanicum]
MAEISFCYGLSSSFFEYNSFKARSTRTPQFCPQSLKIAYAQFYGAEAFKLSKRKSILELENVQNSFTRKLIIRSG